MVAATRLASPQQSHRLQHASSGRLAAWIGVAQCIKLSSQPPPAAATAAPTTSIPRLLCLPDEVLKLVLARVPLQDRLGSCCLVHSRLHAAAIAATEQLELGSQSVQWSIRRAQFLLNWLSPYGKHVTRLQIYNLRQPLTQLPCVNLLELRFCNGSIQLGPTADGSPGVVEGITKLTRLELILCDGSGVDSLSRLVHLRHLHWAPQAGDDVVGFSDAMLPRLRHLTHLNARLSLIILQLGALTSLQNLILHCDSTVAVSPGSITGLVLPASLTRLDLTLKKRLDLALLPAAPTGLRELGMAWGGGGAGGALYEPPFSSIARLQCLTRLEMHAWGALAWPPPGPAYAALTASSSLVSFELAGDLAAGVWPYMFGATHQLPHLTYLMLDSQWHNPEGLAFGAAELAGLVSCCPKLCSLWYVWLQHGPHIAELHKLTALTCLVADFVAGDAVGTIQGLAAVTQLRRLEANLGTTATPLSMASLLPLTSLTALTRITCRWCDGENNQDVAGCTQAGSPPDVWQQLLEACAAADPDCQPSPAQPGAADDVNNE